MNTNDKIDYNNLNYNDYDYDNDDNIEYNCEHIRAPDPVVREKLIENNYYNYNYNHNYIPNKYDTDFENENDKTDDMILEAILKQSKQDYDNEQEQKELLRIERMKLNDTYTGIRNKINRIKGYDSMNHEIYEKILTIIEKYENAEINYFWVEKDVFDKMFIILASLRMTSSEMEFLRKLIIV
jgi:hypothetical protein